MNSIPPMHGNKDRGRQNELNSGYKKHSEKSRGSQEITIANPVLHTPPKGQRVLSASEYVGKNVIKAP